MRFSVIILIVGYALASCESSKAGIILDGSFEGQAVTQNTPYYLQPNGQKWGAGWNNWGWSSWQANYAGPWVGGGIARTEEFATGWKWAHTGDVFGIIKDRGTMSQTFTAQADTTAILSWYDANRNSWRGHTWFGRPNDYSVTITDNLGNTQTIGNYTSQVYGGFESNSWIDASDDRFTLENRQGWVARTGAQFNLLAGRSYTLSFNSLSPYNYDSNGNISGVDDRTTLLDDISVLELAPTVPEPSTMAIFGLGGLGLAYLRRRRNPVNGSLTGQNRA